MNLLDLIGRAPVPNAWEEGDNIPWNDPAFSARMLREHLSQAHDMASRRTGRIEQHVDWIHHEVLHERPARILDLGCGPGLYTSRLARLGHECVGIDFSPASIAYAQETARREDLRCVYRCEDIRQADYGSGFHLAMLIFGEFNVFSPADARHILRRARAALESGGLVLLEPHTFAAVQKIGEQPRSWHSAQKGLFSDQPYLALEENFWDAVTRTATTRHIIVDARSAEVTRYAASYQAYTRAEYESALNECGLAQVKFWPSLTGAGDEVQSDLLAIVARKGIDD